MNISVILAHPDRSSFNHAIASHAIDELRQQGHNTSFHDLYAENFDPLLLTEEIPKGSKLSQQVGMHCDEIANADGIVIIHPNWWGQPPAILTGWIDRVIRPGIAYGFVEGDSGEGVPVGLLKANTALIFNTSNTDTEREIQVFGDPLELIWKNCIFGLCGVTHIQRTTFNIVITSTLEQRQHWLSQVRNSVKNHFPAAAHA